MPMSETVTCCRCCFSFVFTSGLTALFLWLSLRADKPTCSIEEFSVFALNSSAPNTTARIQNHTLYFDLKLNNKNNKDKGIAYDTINLTFHYKRNCSFPIANNTFPGFYQGHEKSTHRRDTAQVQGLDWEKAAAEAANNTAVFRVCLRTAVRYKIVFWKTKRHRLDIGADLPVDMHGSMVRKNKKKGIKLSDAPPALEKTNSRCWCRYLALVVGLLGVF